MIRGYIVNNSGRHKHIFKHRFGPGMRLDLEEVYAVYKRQYKGNFDEKFLEWFKKHKLPSGDDFELVIESIYEGPYYEEIPKVNERDKINEKHPSELTSTEIANLRIKDDPKEKLKYITSIHKLRRALTRCRKSKGKEMLAGMIKARIKELMDTKDQANAA